MSDPNEIAEFTIGITKIDGSDFGKKEFGNGASAALRDTTFRFRDATLKITRVEVKSVNI
ncbi:hypothetical protein [Mycobacterium deserti]|uniref:Lipid/polyisoprenoid-binding YceI-like domain-containing protein n=1 Tax=Mycobacterium deserti TaxID=2978347 RepID=A0ABT2MAV5_9MYCO|nr:hypothetical protein [Mycobacterium deserti]MCT7659408.1 hypothetical protein [Mycobacterium deserti]